MNNVFADLTLHLTLTGSCEDHPAATTIHVYIYPVDEPATLAAHELPASELLENVPAPRAEDVTASSTIAAPEQPPAPWPPRKVEGPTLTLCGAEELESPVSERTTVLPRSPVVPQGPRGGVRKTCPICGIPIGPASIACKKHYADARRAQRLQTAQDALAAQPPPPGPPARSSAGGPDPSGRGPQGEAPSPASRLPAFLRNRLPTGPAKAGGDGDEAYSELDLSELHGSRIA